MLTIVTKTNQTLIDLALQLYGNVDAVGELLALNNLSVNVAEPLAVGIVINYDEASTLMNKRVLQDLASDTSTPLSDQVVMASYVPVSQRLHKRAQAYYKIAQGYSPFPMSFDEVMAVDRLTRDVMGEKNIDYATSNIAAGNIDNGCAQLFPLVGSNLSFCTVDAINSVHGQIYTWLAASYSNMGMKVNNHGLDELLDSGTINIGGNNFCAGAYIGSDHHTIIGTASNVRYYKNKTLLHTLSSNIDMYVALANCASYYVTSNMMYKAIYAFQYDGLPIMDRMDDYLRAFQTSLNRL
jgi:hypothetical protein